MESISAHFGKIPSTNENKYLTFVRFFVSYPRDINIFNVDKLEIAGETLEKSDYRFAGISCDCIRNAYGIRGYRVIGAHGRLSGYVV